jgi:hypothetical protein
MTDSKPPPRLSNDDRTPLGKARNDTLNMHEVWGRHPFADWRYKPPKKGIPWWKQPQEER